jgi:hypothetical protein
MIPFCASSGYKPPQSRQMPVSPGEFLSYILVHICLKKQLLEITDM